jgi:hypothetical protein
VIQTHRIKRWLVWVGAVLALVAWLAVASAGDANGSVAAQCVSKCVKCSRTHFGGSSLAVACATDDLGFGRIRRAQPATLHVTWSGFRGIKFGEKLVDAAKALHGRAACSELPVDRCGVVYPGDSTVSVSGSLRWEGSNGNRFQVRAGRAVGSFQSFASGERRVEYPLGTFIGQSLADFRRELGSGARRERPEHNAALGYYLVGPHGRTLWGWGDRQTGLVAIGLAESLAGARFDWSYEG